MEFNEEKYITTVKPHADKLVEYFQKKQVTFSPSDGDLKNVIFTKGDKVIKISHHSFYRFSGISCIHKEKGESGVEMVTVTDEMYMENFMKPIVELLLKS